MLIGRWGWKNVELNLVSRRNNRLIKNIAIRQRLLEVIDPISGELRPIDEKPLERGQAHQMHHAGITDSCSGSDAEVSTASREEFVDEVFHIDDDHVLVEHIPAKVCVRCGESTFTHETTEKIRQLVHSEAIPARSVPMDVFAYA